MVINIESRYFTLKKVKISIFCWKTRKTVVFSPRSCTSSSSSSSAAALPSKWSHVLQFASIPPSLVQSFILLAWGPTGIWVGGIMLTQWSLEIQSGKASLKPILVASRHAAWGDNATCLSILQNAALILSRPHEQLLREKYNLTSRGASCLLSRLYSRFQYTSH